MGLRMLSYYIQCRQSFLQIANSPIQTTKLLFSVDVLGVLGSIAFGGSFSESFYDIATTEPNAIQFSLQSGEACRRYIG